jgi:ABC-type glycerol-3-phosphate transport system substrate-binding protein
MKFLRSLMVVSFVLFIAMAPAFAGGGQSGGAASGSTPIRWITVGDSGAKPMVTNDRIVAGINQKLGINLNVEIIPENNFEKINVAMASGDFPDIVTGSYGTAATQSWIDNGMVIALNPYLAGNPSLKDWLEKEYAWDADAKGNHYGVPFITQYNAANALITTRSDWLAKVGMKYPATLDEFKALLTAYVKNDPDGNGWADTIGLSVAKNYNFPFVFFAYGRQYADYELDAQGNVIPFFEAPCFIPGMTYIKDLWDNGLIDTEYMLNDSPRIEEKFYQGRAGVIIPALFRHVSRIEGNLQKISPSASIVYGPPPKGSSGASGLNSQGKGGMDTFVTKASKAPDKAAAFINFMLSPEGTDYLRLGIEGVHFTRQNGKIVFNEAEREKDAFAANGWAHPLAFGNFFWPLESGYLPETEPARDRALESTKLATAAQVPNLIKRKTDAEVRDGSLVDDVFQQYFSDILTGKLGIRDGAAALSRAWRSQGGDRILADLNAAYKEQQ